MAKSVAIYTSLEMNPPHPRIQMEVEILEKQGYQVHLVCSPTSKKHMSFFYKVFYYMTLTYFRWDLIFKYRTLFNNNDVHIVYDFTLLPLAYFKKSKDNKIVYETLDNNVELTYYNATKNIPFSFFFRIPVTYFFAFIEKQIIRFYIDRVLVNSDYLMSYLDCAPKTTVNYYASPFEALVEIAPLEKGTKPALLYLGIFSEEKGATQILELQKQYDIPLFIFGEQKTSSPLPKDEKIWIFPRMSIHALYEKIKEYSKDYYFIGLSLIQDVNPSYANQPANKDIDYLALSIPFIGNQRATTAEIINQGCGVFIENEKDILKIIEEKVYYNKLSINSLAYYKKAFGRHVFSKKLHLIFN